MSSFALRHVNARIGLPSLGQPSHSSATFAVTLPSATCKTFFCKTKPHFSQIHAPGMTASVLIRLHFSHYRPRFVQRMNYVNTPSIGNQRAHEPFLFRCRLLAG